ncbi:MAG: zinc metallopeptidase [Anaerolineae bacterium]|jgi:hypothetical protein|nr:zinc metallopeptidase [Anaerolineae bacterium]
MFFDPAYMIFVALPTLVLSGLAQWYVRSSYNHWLKQRNTMGLSGAEVAQRIMRAAPELRTVRLEGTPGELSDHFDPRGNIVRMSPSIAQQPSVASMAIVAHELGHAQQYAEKSALIAVRQFLLPAVQLSPNIAYGLILFGLFTQATGLLWLGILVFGLSVVFMVLTLPVEIDASRRGLALLRQAGLMQTDSDSGGSRQVLTAAALTYIAAAVSSVLTLLYYVMLAQRSSSND